MPNADRTRRHVAFTREGWSFIAILAFVVFGSILRQINLLVMLASMMIPALLFNWRMAVIMIRRINVKHSLGPWIFAGRTTVIELEVMNGSRTFNAWNLALTDSIQRVIPAVSGPAKTVGLVAVSAEANHQMHVSYRCFFAERGIYRLGPVQIACQFPFGLVKAWFQQLETADLHVAPRLGELKPAWNKRRDALAVGMASAARRRGWLPEEFFGLRAWQQGDSTRAIHWRSTAKRGELIVKQFDQPTDRDFALALDLFEASPNSAEPNPWVEAAASFVATVMAHLNFNVHGRMAVAVCGAQSRLFTNQVPGEFVGSVMQELASVQASSHSELLENVKELTIRVSPGTPIIVVTTRTPSELEMLLAHEAAESIRSDLENNVHWIHVDSTEFRDMFTAPTILDFSSLPLDNATIIGPDTED